MWNLYRQIGRQFTRLSGWVYGKALKMVPLALFGGLAALHWRCGAFFCSSQRWQGWARYDIGAKVLKLDEKTLAGAQKIHSLEVLLDRRIACTPQRYRNWPGLFETALELQTMILKLREQFPDQPVILSPFHYVSQYVCIHVCDAVRDLMGLETIGLVSGVPWWIYDDENKLVPNIRIYHTYDEGSRNSLGINFFRSLKKDGIAILFADVAPFSFSKMPMETVGVKIFGRPARIHVGVYRLGSKINAILLPFYLKFRQGRFEGICMNPIHLRHSDAPQQVADYIEMAMRDNYSQWLQSGHPSMYWFATNK